MHVGLLGLGHMGQAMARDRISGGHDLTVYNGSRMPADALAKQGARVAE